MALAKEDLSAIRDVINEAYDELFVPRFDDHDERLSRQTLKLPAVKNELSDMNAKVDAGLFAVGQKIDESKHHLEGRVDALEADIKELYKMIVKLDLCAITDKKYAKISIERRLLLLYDEFQTMAKQAGITLPR